MYRLWSLSALPSSLCILPLTGEWEALHFIRLLVSYYLLSPAQPSSCNVCVCPVCLSKQWTLIVSNVRWLIWNEPLFLITNKTGTSIIYFYCFYIWETQYIWFSIISDEKSFNWFILYSFYHTGCTETPLCSCLEMLACKSESKMKHFDHVVRIKFFFPDEFPLWLNLACVH